MAGPLVPIMIGQRILQVAQPRALELVRAGVARFLPAMKDIGSRAAGPNATGPFYGNFTSNVPTMAQRFNPMGYGAAGLAGAGSIAAGGTGSFEGVRDSLFGELNARGAAGPSAPPVRPMDSTLFGEDAGPRPAPMRAVDSTLAGYDSPPVQRAVQVARAAAPRPIPTPPPRPQEYAAPRPAAPAPVGPSSRELWEAYNQSESPADFVRADKAMREGRAAGGQAPTSSGKHDAIAKALEIIHHLIMRG